MAQSLFALALVGTAVAQTTTVQLLVPMGYEYPLEASVVDVSPSLTTYIVNCPEGTNDDCFLGPYSYVTQGPSSWVSELSTSVEEIGEVSQSVGCTLNWEDDVAICTAEVVYDGTSSGQVDTISDLNSYVSPVAVTAGVDQLPGVSAVITTEDVSSATEEASSATEEVFTTTVIVVSSTETSPSDESTTTESPSTTSTAASTPMESEEETTETAEPGAAGRMASQNAALVGVVALIGGVLML
ncbi:hypothetical protein S40288_05460 [Stachybotrys chartarum IBT 40288]|nr:hypothetical protein S40288_05460 [Stachybotrys chartarum IBT 40288]